MKSLLTLAIASLILLPNLAMASKNSGAPDEANTNNCDSLNARMHQSGSVVFFHANGATTIHYASAAGCRERFGQGPEGQAAPAIVPASDTKNCQLGFVCAGDAQ